MDSRVRFAVAGEPIGHSLSPELFALVAEHLGLDWDMPRRISTSTSELLFTQLTEGFQVPDSEFVRSIQEVTKTIKSPSSKYIPHGDTYVSSVNSHLFDEIEMDCFVSITSPLKHQFTSSPINCLKLKNNVPEYFNSDGLGFVSVARHFGICPEDGNVLGLKGGGSAAIATAQAWRQAGGKLNLHEGRRKLDSIFYNLQDNEKEDIFVDYDNSTIESNALTLNSRYDGTSIGSIENNVLDGTWLLVAQHLITWSHLFQLNSELPSICLLMSRLATLLDQ